VQRRPGFGRTQVGAEDSLDPPEPLIERGPGQVRALGRRCLVAAGREVGGEHIEQRCVGLGGEQGTEFPLHERLYPRVVAEQALKHACACFIQIDLSLLRGFQGLPYTLN